jgi:hypothetical protein
MLQAKCPMRQSHCLCVLYKVKHRTCGHVCDMCRHFGLASICLQTAVSVCWDSNGTSHRTMQNVLSRKDQRVSDWSDSYWKWEEDLPITISWNSVMVQLCKIQFNFFSPQRKMRTVGTPLGPHGFDMVDEMGRSRYLTSKCYSSWLDTTLLLCLQKKTDLTGRMRSC